MLLWIRSFAEHVSLFLCTDSQENKNKSSSTDKSVSTDFTELLLTQNFAAIASLRHTCISFTHAKVSPSFFVLGIMATRLFFNKIPIYYEVYIIHIYHFAFTQKRRKGFCAKHVNQCYYTMLLCNVINKSHRGKKI